MTDIHDIKPLETLAINPDIFLYLVLGAMVLAVLVGTVMYFRRDKKKPHEWVDIISSEDSALNALESISGLMDSNGRLFYFQLSFILREYMKNRFNMDATEMTTEELLPRIEALKLERGLIRGVKEFVYSSDPIKFAGHPADIKNMNRHFEFVKDFVKKTKNVSKPAKNEFLLSNRRKMVKPKHRT